MSRLSLTSASSDCGIRALNWPSSAMTMILFALRIGSSGNKIESSVLLRSPLRNASVSIVRLTAHRTPHPCSVKVYGSVIGGLKATPILMKSAKPLTLVDQRRECSVV
jgi:hypothetical protein